MHRGRGGRRRIDRRRRGHSAAASRTNTLRAMAAALGFDLPGPDAYGVAMLFLPRDAELRRRCEEIFADLVTQDGLKMLGWRDVPTDNRCLGDLARTAEPVVRQAFIGGQGREDEDLERRLYVVRKRIERRVIETLGLGRRRVLRAVDVVPHRDLQGHVPGAATVRLLSGPGRDTRVETALAIVHQRYSTNTFPSWRLAQPFRMIAHNGEINTLRGNTNRLQGKEKMMTCPALTTDMSELFPILQPGGSDSALLRQRDGAAGPRRPLGAARPDDDDSRGLRAAVPHFDRQAGVLRVSRRRSWSRGTGRRPWSSPTDGWWAARWTATACGPAAMWSPPTGWWCSPARWA